MALAIARTPWRYGEIFYPRHDIYIGQSLRVYGEYSQAETGLLLSLLKPGDAVIEAGANIGAITVPMAQVVGPQGGVLAFEPQRVLHQILCANAVVNELANIHAFHAAAGAQAGQIFVPVVDYAKANNFGGLSLGGGGETVSALAIDDLGLQRLALLKVDVEGMELDVLKGAAATIGRCRPILYVENDVREGAGQVVAFIRELGYRLWRHRPALYNPANWNGNGNNLFGTVVSKNLLCLHRDCPPPPLKLEEEV